MIDDRQTEKSILEIGRQINDRQRVTESRQVDRNKFPLACQSSVEFEAMHAKDAYSDPVFSNVAKVKPSKQTQKEKQYKTL